MSRALEEQRDFLLAALRTLEADHAAGLVDDEDYAGLRDDYTVRAANVLRSLEREGDADAAGSTPPAARSRASTVAALVGVGLVVVLAMIVLTRASTERQEGETLTGGDSVQSVAVDQGDAAAAELLRRAQSEFSSGQYAAAIKTYDEVLAVDADQVEALTYRGWLLRLVAVQAAGEDRDLLQTRALASLDRAVELAPNVADARVFRAILRRDLGDDAGALADLDALPPEGVPDFMQPMVDNLRAELAAGSPGRSATSPQVGTPR